MWDGMQWWRRREFSGGVGAEGSEEKEEGVSSGGGVGSIILDPRRLWRPW